MSPRSQPGGWERILRGSASGQERGGGSPPRMGSQPGGLFQLGQGLYLNLVPFNSESRIQNPESISRGLGPATTKVDHTSALLCSHQIVDLVGV
ncbi:hypothetical protein [Nostoc sp.]|uniref:hypothetical protein n=1 Tax=Nostoc sp. TaxID=1180 RepID=UPI002FFA126F